MTQSLPEIASLTNRSATRLHLSTITALALYIFLMVRRGPDTWRGRNTEGADVEQISQSLIVVVLKLAVAVI